MSASVVSPISSNSPLSEGQQLALLTMRRSELSAAVLEKLAQAGGAGPQGRHFYEAARLGLAIRNGEFHTLTPRGRYEADRIGREIAHRFGLHVISWGCCTSQTQGVLLWREPDWESGGHLSAWDMAVNFYFSAVHHIIDDLTRLVRVSNHNMKYVESLGGHESPAVQDDPKSKETMDETMADVKRCVEASKIAFASLKCAHIDNAARRLESCPERWSELNARTRALRDAIEIELRQYWYFQYPKQKAEKFINWKSEWEKSRKAFPDIEPDVFAATDCYALGHNTASVFHSMRVAEYGLRSLAKERRVRLPKNKPIEWGTWREIIKELDKAIEYINGKKAGAAKDAALEFYSGARADLNGFKDEYRNLVSHLRATYDEHQALRALTNVHSFMERIATKIDHRHHRIRWGLR